MLSIKQKFSQQELDELVQAGKTQRRFAGAQHDRKLLYHYECNEVLCQAKRGI